MNWRGWVNVKNKYVIGFVLTLCILQLNWYCVKAQHNFDVNKLITELNDLCPMPTDKGSEMVRVELRENRYVTYVFRFTELQEEEINAERVKTKEAAKLKKRLRSHAKEYAPIFDNGYSVARAVVDKDGNEVCFVKHN